EIAARMHNNLGAAYIKTQRYEDAIEEFRHAIAIDPEYVEPYYNLGSVLMAFGRYAEAIAVFLRGLAVNPGHVALRAPLGVARSARERRERGEPPVSRREDGPLPPTGRPREVRRAAVGRLAGREPRPRRGAAAPLRELRGREDPLCHRALHERDEPPARRPRAQADRSCVPRRRVLDRRHGDLAVGLPRVPGPEGAGGLPPC